MNMHRMQERTGSPAGQEYLLVTNCSGRSGNETHVSQLGNLHSILLFLVLDCVMQDSQRSTAELDWVAAGASGPAHHQREEALTPIHPSGPKDLRDLTNGHASLKRTTGISCVPHHTAPEASYMEHLWHWGPHSCSQPFL